MKNYTIFYDAIIAGKKLNLQENLMAKNIEDAILNFKELGLIYIEITKIK